jgi:fatty-acyl-CoA synthase
MGPEMAEAKAGSIGRPNAFVEARLVREDGQLAATGEVGELQLRGPCGFSGYYGEAVPKEVGAQGWFRTGDLARRDADGFYFIAGRRKDMFISGGENVFPLEVEQALQAHPAVQQAAVIGVPDPAWGEAGCAYVVLRHGAIATEAELLAHVRERLARFKVPKAIRFIPELPLSAAGKVLKGELHERERVLEAAQAQIKAPTPAPGAEASSRSGSGARRSGTCTVTAWPTSASRSGSGPSCSKRAESTTTRCSRASPGSGRERWRTTRTSKM